MSRDSSPWQDGRRAWERLNGWHQDAPAARPGHPDDGDGALSALADVCRVRHLLDQAELVAVKTARRHNKSWAEIATNLGVTRQSAWERWRDLDDGARRQPAEDQPEQLPPAKVPNVIGLHWERARLMLAALGLVAAGPDPDGLPLAVAAQPGSVVSDQSPESGATVPPGSTVILWLDRGEGGVREPRRPAPTPLAGRRMQPEPADEAVG